MKKSVFVLICFLQAFYQAQAQSSIGYDFKAKELDAVKPLKLDNHISFRINNINKFLYEVSISSKQGEFHSDVPAVFRLLEVEQTQKSGVGDEAKKTLEQQTSQSSSYAIERLVEKGKNLSVKQDKLTLFTEKLNYINMLSDSSMPKGKVAELEEKIAELKKEIYKQEKTIQELNDILDDEYTKAVGELYREAMMVDQAFEHLERSKILKNRLSQLAMTDGVSYQDMEARTDDLFQSDSFSANSEKLLAVFDLAYKKFKSSYQLFLENPVVLKKFKDKKNEVKESVSSLFSEVEALKTSVGKSNYDEIFKAILTLFSELRNPNNFFAVSDPVQAEKDVLIFDVKITPRKDIKPQFPTETRNFPVKVKIYGGVKIDFSTGVFATTNLYNREYYTNPVAGSTQSVIKEGKSNSIVQPSFGALMHISHRTTNAIKPAFSFGLGLTTTDIASATLFAGPGVIIGNKERFILSSGIAAGEVDVLKSKYELGTPYEATDLDDELTVKVTKLSWFISFTYNLTNKEKE